MKTIVKVYLKDEHGNKDWFVTPINLPEQEAHENYISTIENGGFFFLMSCLLLVPNIYSTFWISWISKQLLQPSRCCAYYTLLQILSENLYSVPVNHYRLLHGILLFYSHSFAEPYSPVTTYLNISNLIFPDILLQRGIFY